MSNKIANSIKYYKMWGSHILVETVKNIKKKVIEKKNNEETSPHRYTTDEKHSLNKEEDKNVGSDVDQK